MKKILVLLLFVIICSVGMAEEFSKKERIVVLPFKNLSGTSYNDVEFKMASSLAGKLTEMGRFEIIDRTELEKIMQEQKLALLGVLDPEQVVEIGKIAAAKKAFIGNIIKLNIFEEEYESEVKLTIAEKKSRKYPAGQTTRKVTYRNWVSDLTVNFKVIDVETNNAIEGYEINVKIKGNDKEQRENVVEESFEKINEKALFKMKEIFKIKTYIIEKNERKAVIRFGNDMGLKKNMEFRIYSDPKTITDPMTGKEYKAEGVNTGLLIVTKINENTAYGKIVKGMDKVKIGDLIKEKSLRTVSLDLSMGNMPFNIDKNEALKAYNYNYNGRRGSFIVEIEQEKKEDALYLELDFTANYYHEVNPELSLGVILNDPIPVYYLDLGANYNKEITDVFRVSAGINAGYALAYGKVGEIDTNTSLGGYDVENITLDTEYDIENAEAINISGGSFVLKLKGEITYLISEKLALFTEAGYNMSKVSSWKIKTKNSNGDKVEIDSIDIGSLNMTGLYYGFGIKLVF